uniref:Uncharacterized protein n=1 Tax=Anguilla anguilla TaxID=7936 RepID=A0A0E9VFI1_ANGAN
MFFVFFVLVFLLFLKFIFKDAPFSFECS